MEMEELMMNSMLGLERTLDAYATIFPPQQPQTKFDKLIELVEAYSSGTLAGAIGQVLQATIKTYGIIKTDNNRIEALKYVADAYEVKSRADVELKGLELKSEKNRTLTLFIDRKFQADIDKIHKDHMYRMSELSTNKEIVLYKIDKYAQSKLMDINQKYATIIRQNEAACETYRKYLNAVKESGEDPSHMMCTISKSYMDIVMNSVFDKSVNMADVEMGLESALKLLDFWQKCDNSILPFEEFIQQKKILER